MAFYKNVASQKIAVFAYDSTDGTPKTGDAANITAQISKDGAAAAATDDTNPTELDAVDHPGVYLFDMLQAESNADLINLTAVSSTSNILLEPVFIYTIPGTSAGLLADLIATATSPKLVDDIWDELLTGATHNVATSAGRRLRAIQDYSDYEDGAVWIDTINGSAGTTDFENGTVSNPVDSIADALTIAASVGLARFRVLPGSSITFAASMDGYELVGVNWSCGLGGQSVSGTVITGATVTGNDDGSNASATIYEHCLMGTNTLGLHRLERCGLSATITLSEAGTYDWVQCHSRVAGTGTPGVDVGAAVANTNLNMRRYSGGIEVQNLGASGTDNMSLEGHGQLVLNVNCAGGTLAIRGHFPVTDNAGGAVTLSDAARFDHHAILDTAGTEVTAIKAVTDVSVYQAKAWLIDDEGNTTDRWIVAWFKNGVPITSGITLPKIQVVKGTDGTDLVAETAMLEIGTTEVFQKTEATNRVADGASYLVVATATIDGSVRTWYQPMGRDSSA